jgi:protein TonB
MPNPENAIWKAGKDIALSNDTRFPHGGIVSRRLIRQWLTTGMLAAASLLLASPLLLSTSALAQQQDELTRKVKSKVAPVYPDVARRMSIAGVVKIAVVVAPNGNLKSTKIVGGHPLLVNAALDALKKWKFEPASEESTGVVEFKFEPQN